jgi:hypothetical protein
VLIIEKRATSWDDSMGYAQWGLVYVSQEASHEPSRPAFESLTYESSECLLATLDWILRDRLQELSQSQSISVCSFRNSQFDELALGLDTAFIKADRDGVTQEYVKEVRKPEHRVLFAVRVLASLLGCEERSGLDHAAEQWEVTEERAAYASYIGVSEERRKTISSMYNFVQQPKRASKSKKGKQSNHWTQKRNAVVNVLRAGLGIELDTLGKKSNNKLKTPHVIKPGPWKAVHSRYGVLQERQVARSEEECMIVPR